MKQTITQHKSIDWMSDLDGMSLERKDVNGNYSKENCIWDTPTEQAFNQRKSKANTSGYTGVCWDQGRWKAKISKENVEYYLGSFSTFEEAVEARRRGEMFHYGYYKEQ